MVLHIIFSDVFTNLCENSHDAFTIVSIIIQFSNVIFPGMAASCAILVGSELGNNNIEKQKQTVFAWLFDGQQ